MWGPARYALNAYTPPISADRQDLFSSLTIPAGRSRLSKLSCTRLALNGLFEYGKGEAVSVAGAFALPVWNVHRYL